MEIGHYQTIAWKSYMGRDLPLKDQVVNHCLGITGEVGEIVDQVKKEFYIGRDITREELVEEFGDVLWHLCCMASSRGISMGEIMEYNINKLKVRYPNADW